MVEIFGNSVSKTSTVPIVSMKGNTPRKTSVTVIDLSSRLLCVTKQATPKGGVNKPISTATTVITPNQIKSCLGMISSAKGTTISRIDRESRKQPRKTSNS